MHPRLTRPIRLTTGVIAATALSLTACGSDDNGGGGGGSGGGSTEAFCDEIQTLAESTGETTEEEDLAALQKVADVAPDEIADEMNELLDGFEQLQAFDPEAASEEEMGDFLAIADGLDEASTAIEEFALDNCPDIPADLFETE
jgi:hypothetical protein